MKNKEEEVNYITWVILRKASESYEVTLESTHEKHIGVGWIIMDHLGKIISGRGSYVCKGL